MQPGDRRRMRNLILLGLFIWGFSAVWPSEVAAPARTYVHTQFAPLSETGVDRYIDQPFLLLLGVAVVLVFVIFGVPVMILIALGNAVTRHFFGFSFRVWGLSWPPYISIPIGLFYGWLFWKIILPRFLKLIGLWDPFRRSKVARPWTFRLYRWFRDWYDLHGFGKGPTGGWASLSEVLCWSDQEDDLFLGRPKFPWHLGGMLRPIGIPTEKHMVTIAGTGAGKSAAAMIPNLCLHRGSLLVVDVKGELARTTARRRGAGGNGVQGMQQTVAVLDPFHTAPEFESAVYNVFDEMEAVAAEDAEQLVNYASTIARALVPVLNERDSYWEQTGQDFVAALVLYVFTLPREQRDLTMVRKLLTEGDVAAYKRDLESGDITRDQNLSPMDVLYVQMELATHAVYGEYIRRAALVMSGMDDRPRSSVLSAARTHTSFLDGPEIRRVVRGKSSFLIKDMKTKPVSVYLCLPPNEVVGKSGHWLRLFILLLVDMMYKPGKKPAKRMKHPILLALDEYPSLGPLPTIQSGATMLRSYGIRLWIIAQDTDQMKARYPKDWETFLGSAEAIQFMSTKHRPTVQYIVDLLEKQVVIEKHAVTGQEVRSVYNLLNTDQVPRLLHPKRQNQIIWRGDARPMLLKICRYFDYMPYWYFSPDARYRQKLRHWFWRPWLSRAFKRSLRWLENSKALRAFGAKIAAALRQHRPAVRH